MIRKIVRIGTVEQQDDFRRDDMLRMSPAERMAAFIDCRNRAFPYEALKRVVHIRKLD